MKPPRTTWEVRRPQLQARDQFELKGRVAVATGSDGFNARLRWTQNGKQTHMSLDGPLGLAECRLRRMALQSASSLRAAIDSTTMPPGRN